MMTIDDMLSQIAKNTAAVHPKTPEKPKKTEEKPLNIKSHVKNSPAQKSDLTLDLAKEIIYCIEKGAEKSGIDAVISVVNAEGRLIALEAMDNSLPISVKASQDKAHTAAVLKMTTEKALAESRGGAFDGLSNGDGILLLGGGCPLMAGNKVIGAVGVSGGTKDDDIMLAKLGVAYLSARIDK